MPDTPRAGLASVAREDGTVAIVAMDQRNTLRKMLTDAGRSSEPDELRAFKVDVVEAFSPSAGAMLLDPEYGLPAARAAGALAPECAVLIGVELPDRDRWHGELIARRDPERTAAWVKGLGGDAAKFLVFLRPDRLHRPGEPDLVSDVVELVRGFVEECAAAGIPSIVETLLYPLPDEEPLSDRRRADLIVESARILTETRPDLLKLPYPVDGAGCRNVAGVTTVPWAMLSAGMPLDEFVEAIKIACDDGGASGFVAGRVFWKEAVTMESPERKAFLAATGLARVESALVAMQGRARPWMEASAR